MSIFDWFRDKPNVEEMKKRGDVDGLFQYISHSDRDTRLNVSAALLDHYKSPPFKRDSAYYCNPVSSVLAAMTSENDLEIRLGLEATLSELVKGLRWVMCQRLYPGEEPLSNRKEAAVALDRIDDVIIQRLLPQSAKDLRFIRDVTLLENDHTKERFANLLHRLEESNATPRIKLRSAFGNDTTYEDMTECPTYSSDDIAMCLEKWVDKSSVEVLLDSFLISKIKGFKSDRTLGSSLKFGKGRDKEGWYAEHAAVFQISHNIFKGYRYAVYKDEDGFRGWL